MRKIIAGVFFVGVSVLSRSAGAEPPTDEKFSILILGQPAGFEQVNRAADGALHSHYEYNDRGRGPKLDSVYRLAADCVPQQLDTKGINYLKANVDEHFAVDGGTGRWHSTSEDASAERANGRFYLSVDGPGIESALLVQALLRAPQHHLSLLPAGEAALAKITSATVAGKAGNVAISLYAVTGIDVVPDYLWLDADGRYFASYSSWTSEIRAGWEDVLPAVGKLQDEADRKLAASRAAALAQPVSQALAIEHVRVFDPDTLAARSAQTVLVEGGRIAAVGTDDSVTIPAGARRMDGANRFLMPGLWDMHVHMGAGDGPLDIAAGITTVRDLGNDADYLAALSSGIEANADIGPRIIKAGLIDGRGPYQGPSKVFADNAEEAVKAVDFYAARGYVQIKIYSSMKPELVPVIVREARAKGLRISGHVPAFMNAEQFVADGVDEIQHINFLFLNFFFDRVQDTRTPARFTTIAEHGAELDLGSPRVAGFINLLKQHHIVSDPTLVAFEDMFLERPGQMGPSFFNIVGRLPLTWQRQLRAGTQGLPVPAGEDPLYRESFARMVEMVGAMYRSGVTIVAGTDGFDALSLAREFELYVKAGIPPAEVLRLDTLGAATVMNRSRDYGRVAPGYVADLILVDGDPLINIADIRRVRTVLQGDRIYDSGAVFQAMGVLPQP
jgi:imidazolonepropionase-like amidohydrolase